LILTPGNTPTYVQSGVPFIFVKDIYDRQVHFDSCKYISMAEHLELARRCAPTLGDVLITKSGTIGRTAIVRTSDPFSLFVSVALIRPASDEIRSEWLEIVLRAWLQRTNVTNDVKGTAIKNLHLEDIRALPVPIPPVEDQDLLIAEVHRRESIVAAVEKTAQATIVRIGALRRSILRLAFEGYRGVVRQSIGGGD
jgi:type I restriction enzyme, S subunit